MSNQLGYVCYDPTDFMLIAEAVGFDQPYKWASHTDRMDFGDGSWLKTVFDTKKEALAARAYKKDWDNLRVVTVKTFLSRKRRFEEKEYGNGK